MKRPYTVGITGGIGAGKSIVCRVFGTLGVPVYDADSRAKWLMNHSEPLKTGIQSIFGKDSFTNGSLNREWLASRIFHDPDLLTQMNQLVHPAVAKDFETWLGQQHTANYVIKEAALLFETGTYRELDHVILVTAPATLRAQRVQLRDAHRSLADIEAIMNKQLDDRDKIPLANSHLINDGRALLVPQILTLHAQFDQASMAK